MKTELLDIEKIKLSSTEEKILLALDTPNESIDNQYLSFKTKTLIPTISTGVKSLCSKKLITVDSDIIYLTDFGKKMTNFLTFRNKVLLSFCNINQISFEEFIKTKKQYTVNMILGIHNLINATTYRNSE